MGSDAALEAAIADAIRRRGPGKTICPSEVARALRADWRAVMPDIRRVAQDMALRGALVITQRGDPVDPLTLRGPIRLGLPRNNTLA